MTEISRIDHYSPDAHTACADAGTHPPSEAKVNTVSSISSLRTEDALLLIYADALDDFERTRIANENRLRSLRQVKDMEDTPESARMAGMLEALAGLEHQVSLDLQRAMRRHSLGPWINATIGIGMKQGARLLAAIGDPAERQTVSQLWAYCGLHVWHLDHRAGVIQSSLVEVPTPAGSNAGHARSDIHATLAGVAPRRMKGRKANWNTKAKMRVFLVAESCIKQARSPYRAVYDAGRAKYDESVHETPCAQCGGKGPPALVGSPLRNGHKHARAMRLVMKAILRDLWVEARSLSASMKEAA